MKMGLDLGNFPIKPLGLNPNQIKPVHKLAPTNIHYAQVQTIFIYFIFQSHL